MHLCTGTSHADVGPSETTDIAGDPLRSTFAGQFCGGNADSNGGGSWVDFYNKDPGLNATSATPSELQNVLGGEISRCGCVCVCVCVCVRACVRVCMCVGYAHCVTERAT